MIDELKFLLKPYNISCSDEQLNKFQLFFDLLLEWNQKMNLTAITNEKDVLIKHFFDSVTPAFYYKFTDQRVIDIGAGAGFPSIPLKICFPALKFTLLDSLNKRITFLNHVIEVLELNNIETIHGRAEELARRSDYRENFDIAISRAVARLNILSELALPFVKVSGNMIALKGANLDDEVVEAKKAITILGSSISNKYIFNLPENYGERTIFIIKKSKNTPQTYPRKAGIPGKNPLH